MGLALMHVFQILVINKFKGYCFTPKSFTKMKNIKLITATLIIMLSLGFGLVNAKVVVPAKSDKKLIVCGSGDQNGTTTMGNTCTDGTNVCIPNPCY